MISKPTPTPEEIDRARLGDNVANKEPDGSAPDPHGQPSDPNALPEGFVKEGDEEKSMAAGAHPAYKTRSLGATPERQEVMKEHQEAVATARKKAAAAKSDDADKEVK